MRHRSALCFALLALVAYSGCASRTYTYHYVPGWTAMVQNGYAVAPSSAPPAVHAVIAAGNQIAGSPYGYGGGHGRIHDRCFDCSGATSHVLQSAGWLDSPMPWRGF